MLKNIRKLAGISLFEMMLVMVIISMVVVAGIRYVKIEQEKKAALAYGVKLYTFGQAVNSYVTHSQELRTSNLASLPGPEAPDGSPTVNSDPSIEIGTDPETGSRTIKVTGTDWLKPDKAGTYNNVPFLDKNFTFNSGLAPLTVGKSVDDEFKEGDEVFSAVISFVDPANPMTSAYNISINAGVLYQKPRGPDAVEVPLPALTADAIKHANELYTSYQGAAAITYTLPPVDDGTPPTKVQGTLSTIAQRGDAFLRIDGNNYMEGPVRFNPETVSTTSQAKIENVNVLKFHAENGRIQNLNKLTMVNAANASSLISSLATLEFVTGTTIKSEIKNLKKLAFTPGGANSPSRIIGLNELNFDNPALSGTVGSSNKIINLNTLSFQQGNAENVIEHLGTVKFKNSREFSGLVISAQDFIGTPGAQDSKFNVTRLVPNADENDVCFVTGFKFKDGDGSNDNFKSCMVYKDNGEWRITGKEVRYCAVTCLRWAP